MTKEGGKLRSILIKVKILGKEGLHNLGFDIPQSSKLVARQDIMLNRVEEEFPSTSDIANTGNIELQETTGNIARNTEDLITQLDDPPSDSLEHPLCELLGLDKELRSIRGLLKVEMVKKIQLEEHIERGKCKLSEI